MYLMV